MGCVARTAGIQQRADRCQIACGGLVFQLEQSLATPIGTSLFQ
jgi:hypothetical protein